MNARLTLLQATHQLIDSGEVEYICIALRRAGFPLGLQQLAEDLRDEIRKQLNGFAALDSWLHQQTNGVISLAWDTAADHNRQAMMRLAWLDKMIEEAT